MCLSRFLRLFQIIKTTVSFYLDICKINCLHPSSDDSHFTSLSKEYPELGKVWLFFCFNRKRRGSKMYDADHLHFFFIPFACLISTCRKCQSEFNSWNDTYINMLNTVLKRSSDQPTFDFFSVQPISGGQSTWFVTLFFASTPSTKWNQSTCIWIFYETGNMEFCILHTNFNANSV